jgi:diguanylate cyclase (GGDEF)-like protein
MTPDHDMALHLEQRGLLDLAQRAKRGSYLHLPLWLLLCLWTGVATRAPVMFWTNTLLFGLNTAARLRLHARFERLVIEWPQQARVRGFILLMMPCLQWGLLTAVSLYWVPMQPLFRPLELTAVGLATAGSVVLSINRTVRLAYPVCVLVPLLAALLASPGADNLLQALMALVLLIYVLAATRLVHDDYWAALEARTELEARARNLEALSFTDALTQIPNRLYFEQSLGRGWSGAMRDRRAVTMLLVDLDHFKRINDTYGHSCGDACLKAAAQALRAPLQRGADLVARYGGEEFAVLLEGSDAAAGQATAQRLLRSVAAARVFYDGTVVRFGCSIGVATMVPAAGSTPAALVKQADKALYEAKEQGRNRIVVAAAA